MYYVHLGSLGRWSKILTVRIFFKWVGEKPPTRGSIFSRSPLWSVDPPGSVFPNATLQVHPERRFDIFFGWRMARFLRNLPLDPVIQLWLDFFWFQTSLKMTQRYPKKMMGVKGKMYPYNPTMAIFEYFFGECHGFIQLVLKQSEISLLWNRLYWPIGNTQTVLLILSKACRDVDNTI